MAKGEGSGAGCGEGCLKCILIILNIIFGLIGVVFLAVGIFIYVGLDKVGDTFLGDHLEVLNEMMAKLLMKGGQDVSGEDINLGEMLGDFAIPFIVIGAVLFICSILGCCGACCSSKCLLIIYIVICSVILFVEILLVALLFSGKLYGNIEDMLQDKIDSKYGGIDDLTAWSLLFNVVMTKYECCGINGYEDFNEAEKWKKTRDFDVQGQTVTLTLTTPIACCKFTGEFPDLGEPLDDLCFTKLDPDLNNFAIGCWDEVAKDIKKYKNYILGGSIGVIIVQAVIIIIAICIIRCAEKEDDD